MTRTITAANLSPMPWARRAFASLAGMALVLTGLPQSSFAALTDLAQTPIAANAAVQVKPNIMLLMDTSGSMAWTHMPDEVEKVGTDRLHGQHRLPLDAVQLDLLQPGHRLRSCRSIADGTFFPQPTLRRRALRRLRFVLHGCRRDRSLDRQPRDVVPGVTTARRCVPRARFPPIRRSRPTTTSIPARRR